MAGRFGATINILEKQGPATPIFGDGCGYGKTWRRLYLFFAEKIRVKSPAFEKTTLPGGATLLTERIPYLGTMSLGCWFGFGSRHEATPMEGAAHFIEHMLFKGTRRRTPAALASEIESVGGSLNAMTGREVTCYTVRILPEYLPKALDILLDLCFRSTFPDDEFARERQVILEEIKDVQDTPEDYIYDLHQENCFGRDGLGHPVLGYEDTIGDMPRDSLYEAYRERYSPASMILAAAGNPQGWDLRELVEKHIEEYAAPPPAAAPASGPCPFRTGVRLIPRPVEKAHFVMSVRGVPFDHEDRYVFGVLDMLLSGGMSSRLFQEVREKRGLVYDIATENSHYSDTGVFSVSAGTRPSNLENVLEVIVGELRKVKEGDVKEEEVDRVKNLLRASIAMSLESVGSRMTKIARSEIFYGRNVPDEEIMEQVRRVTLDDIVRVAEDIFRPGGFLLGVLAPFPNGEPGRRLGEILDAV